MRLGYETLALGGKAAWDACHLAIDLESSAWWDDQHRVQNEIPNSMLEEMNQ